MAFNLVFLLCTNKQANIYKSLMYAKGKQIKKIYLKSIYKYRKNYKHMGLDYLV